MSKGKLLLVVGVVMIILGGIAFALAGVPGPASPLIAAKEPLEPLGLFVNQQPVGLWVTGEGKVMAVPDVAILNLGIEAEAKTVAEAHRQATEAMNKVMSTLKEHGVLEKDIQTLQFTIYPVTRWIEKKQREEIIGYRVTNMVTAKIRKIDRAAVIVDAAVKAGGDLIRIKGVNFTVDDPSPYYREAREKAVKDAVAKAKQMAEVAGIKLGKPTYISEVGVHIPFPLRFEAFIEKALPAPIPPPPPPITPGELEIRVNVQIVYKIG